MVVFVAVFHWGAVGLVVGNFVGTLCVYAALVAYRRDSSTSSSTARSSVRCRASECRLCRRRSRSGRSTSSTVSFVSYYKGNGEVASTRSRSRSARSSPLSCSLPHSLAGLRLLDRGRQHGAPRIRLRPDLRAPHRVLDLARTGRTRRRGSCSGSRTPATSAPRRAWRSSRSHSPCTPATPCSRSAAGGPGERR